MGRKSIPVSAVAAVVAILVVLVGYVLFKGATGGTVGDGNAGNVQASPPGQQHGTQSNAAAGNMGQRTP